MKKPTVSLIAPPQIAEAPPADTLRVTILSPHPAQAGKIFICLQALMDDTLIEQIDCPITQFHDFGKQRLPDVLIVDCAWDALSDLVALERISQKYPNLAFILVCEHQSPEFLLHAMRAGVREVLRAPVDPVLLEASLERIRHSMGLAPTRKGKVCALVSCKGGSGATFLAANLAHALAIDGDRKVALLDLNLQFGDALLFSRTITRLPPWPTWRATSIVSIRPCSPQAWCGSKRTSAYWPRRRTRRRATISSSNTLMH